MRRITGIVLLIYLLLIAVAVSLTIAGAQIPVWLTPVNTLLGFIFALLHAIQRYGWKAAVILLACVVIISLAMESLGVATGLVYGPYHYTDKLGIKFLGLVPLLIPIAWFMMMYPATLIAQSLVKPSGKSSLWRMVLTASAAGVVMTAWDVALDPLMVAGNMWVWEVKGAFFGIPVHNFIGWWVTTFLCVGTFLILTQRMKPQKHPLPERWGVVSYGAQAVATVVTDSFIGLAGAGMAGAFAMLPWIIIGWINAKK